MRIAFLDLPFHHKTGSSNFFKDILQKLGKVDTHYVDFNEPYTLRELVDADYDLYILWQLEPLAPFFAYHRRRVVIVPMYDGCHGLGLRYWNTMEHIRSVNFSKALSLEQSGSPLTSFDLQYYPNPDLFPVQTDFHIGKALFWQRRPEQGLTAQFAHALIGHNIQSLHIHNAPDTSDPDDWRPEETHSESRWSDEPKFFNSLMNTHNIFLAPRIAEGIGMAFLEAMARGMLVIAADAPTANEYIENKKNGLLFPLTAIQAPQPLTFSMQEAERMAHEGRLSVEAGFRHYMARQDELMNFLSSTPIPPRPFLMNKRDEKMLLAAGIGFYQTSRIFRKKLRSTLTYKMRKLGIIPGIKHVRLI